MISGVGSTRGRPPGPRHHRREHFAEGTATVADEDMTAPEYQAIPEADQKKAKRFFEQGATVANTGQFDYAIEMYLNGLSINPDAVEAHQALRDIGMKRKATGGKALGMMEKMKLGRPSKDDKQNLINQEKLLSYDPGSTDAMVGVLQNALRAGYFNTVLWVGPILQAANVDSPKPEFKKFIILKDAYLALKRYSLAADACQYARKLKPEDMDLQNEFRHIAALDTMNKGKYDQGGSFVESQKDREGQDQRGREDADIRTADALAPIIAAAKKEYLAEPTETGKINKYVDALVKTEDVEQENIAIGLLQQAFDRTRQFRFRLRIGEINMRQMSRTERSLRKTVSENQQDAEALQNYKQFYQEKLQLELSEFQLAMENYPTTAEYKLQVAVRLVQLRRFDEAIPVLQQLRTDPKWRHDAGKLLGEAFLQAGFPDEAVDTLATTLSDYPVKGDAKATDITYLYGRALEQKGEKAAAVKAYSQVAQISFTYKDVQQRIKKLRAEMGPATPAT